MPTHVLEAHSMGAVRAPDLARYLERADFNTRMAAFQALERTLPLQEVPSSEGTPLISPASRIRSHSLSRAFAVRNGHARHPGRYQTAAGIWAVYGPARGQFIPGEGL